MIGIKGVGMTMLAQFLAGRGVEVSGSDTGEKYMTDKVLKKCGIAVVENFNSDNIPAAADLIIYSTAYNRDNNPEVARALAGKKKVLTYAQALAEVFNDYYGIAAVGSHGKTTTAAWLGYILEKSGWRPNVMVGARVEQLQGSGLAGESNYLVAELDEYQNKLQYFNPRMVLLNNIDYDHPDFFPTADAYRQVFIDFIKKIPAKGFLVANWDDKTVRSVAGVNCKGKLISYGIYEAADYVAYDIKEQGGRQFFKVKFGVGDEEENEKPLSGGSHLAAAGGAAAEGNLLGDFSIQLPGRYNISNALAVIAAAIELGVELRNIREQLADFEGADRRMQTLGKFRGATIIDDYAHHPTEIKAALAGARARHQDKKIIVVFHPHTFTRTKALLDDFARSFGEADEVIVLDIYGSAREQQGGVHSRDLVEKIKEQGAGKREQKIIYIPTLAECEKYLRDNIERGDVVLLMGAGDVFRIGENLVGE